MYQGKTIRYGDRLTRLHGGILNNHVAMDEPSIQGAGLTSTHSKILNTHAPYSRRGTYDSTHHVPRKTIQRKNRLVEPHEGLLNNHVARDESSNQGTRLTSTHSRILNTRAPVTSPTLADYPAKVLR
ncbi:hypothetical protein ACE6H2_026668 [Prunus campanulata]